MNKMEEHPVSSRRSVSPLRRFAYYGAVWILAMIAFEIFLKPDSPAESSTPEFQQRLGWLIGTPLIAVVGLAVAFNWPNNLTEGGVFGAAICFVGHAVITLCQKNRHWFAVMIFIQVILLTLAVISCVQYSGLPGE